MTLTAGASGIEYPGRNFFMPVRGKKVHRKILAILVFFGLQAGLAAGPLRAGAENRPEPLAAAVITPLAAAAEPAASPTSPAADTLATDSGATGTAAPASPAAALVPADRLYLEPILADAARQYGVPVDMILAQAWAESSWKTDAVSNKGAVGVLQLMPKAVDFVSTRLLKLDQPLDALDPAANARMGARYMRHLLDRLDGDMRQALIAYNQGLSGLRRKGPVPAAELYADKVLALRPVFAGQA
jgi:soluble lytic murein transglycosylase-like protein